MADQKPFILWGVPPPIQGEIGEDLLRKVMAAHPGVRMSIVPEQEMFNAQLPEADAVVIWPSFTFPAEALQRGTKLRWIHSIPAGVDDLLTPELIAAEHITISSSKGPMGPMMAEHAVMFMLALARSLPGFLQDQAEHHWRAKDDMHPLIQLYQKTIAILGVGAVGGNLARVCRAGLGMRVLGMVRTRRNNPHVDRYFERAELHAALAEADFVALALALTCATERIIDAAALAAMKPTAYLVNVSRGGLIDEAALIEALRAGEIAGAGLDVTAVEPLPADSPLWGFPNVLITPHISPARDLFTRHLIEFIADNIGRFAAGETPLGVVDRREGY